MTFYKALIHIFIKKGGCQGNFNNFETLESCNEECAFSQNYPASNL